MIIGFTHNAEKSGVAARLTQWFTQQPYTHCELFLAPYSMALSARTDGKGVSLKPAKEVLRRSSEWVFYYVPTYKEYDLNVWAMEQVGKKYDYADIARMFSPVSVKWSDSWFCSELCYVAVRDFGRLPIKEMPPDMVHPGALIQLLILAGAKPVDAYSTLI